MIDCVHLEVDDLLRFGITFSNPDDAVKYVQDFRAFALRHILLRVLRSLSIDQIHECKAIDDLDEKEKWLKEHIPNYQEVFDEVSEEMAWYLFQHRDKLKGAIVNRDKKKEKTSIDELRLSEETCEFLHLYGLDTVEEIISSGDLSYLERTYPQKAKGFRTIVLEYMLSNPSVDQSEIYDLGRIYKYIKSESPDKKSESPDYLLSYLNMSLIADQCFYRKKLISKESYYFYTYTMDFSSELLEMKGVSVKSFIKDRILFEKAEEKWLTTGDVQVEPWMVDFLSHKGDITEAMDWFFKVKNDLFIPTEYYMPYGAFDDFDDETEEFPLVVKNVLYTSECYIYFAECIDIARILDDGFQLGKKYHFHFIDGTTASFTGLSQQENKLIGVGIIDGYMTEENQIMIECSDNHYYFFFDEREGSRLDILLQTVNHPIPHPKWNRYNNACAAKNKAVAEAYKELRWQLVLDCDESHE